MNEITTTLEANLKNILKNEIPSVYHGVVFTGSRGLSSIPYAYFNSIFQHTMLRNNSPDFIIHGNAEGADLRIGNYARLKRIQQIIFPVYSEEWAHYGPTRGPWRNDLMASFAHGYNQTRGPVLALACWDGQSRGTSGASRLYAQAGLPLLTLNFLNGEVNFRSLNNDSSDSSPFSMFFE